MPPPRRLAAFDLAPPATRPAGSRTETTGWSKAGALGSSAWACQCVTIRIRMKARAADSLRKTVGAKLALSQALCRTGVRHGHWQPSSTG